MWTIIFDSDIERNDDLEDFGLSRKGDITLSSSFVATLRTGTTTKSEWKKENNCRQYLKLLIVADISSAYGKSIDGGIFKGNIK